MTDYWRSYPPVHVLVAGYMGYKPDRDLTDAPYFAEALTGIAADMRDELPEHLRSALDNFFKSNNC
ncbi:hypothetical protein [Pseudomonas petroselini]|uniref:hypothetical protein n=1 Tax=Pseudomonas petroselini TaxID=2899822 RepID=UPI00386E00E6